MGRCIGQMSYREVSVIEIVEMLRLWLQGLGLREVARLSGTDRKTVRYADLGITHVMPYRSLCRIGVLVVGPNR